MKIKADYSNEPLWKEVNVKSSLPKELESLDELAHNMWWAWNYEARNMWKSLDEDLYEEVSHNPVLLLERLSYERKQAIVKDKAIMKQVKDVYKKFRTYMDVKPDTNRPSVAYFCMEYGINQVLKIYSGGLGMLAGDYVKEASDSNVDMCAIGFLYRNGYFRQSLSMDGQQIANYDAQNFKTLPVERQYGGDWENRLKQEILLGIGGMLLLKKLGIKKDIYHCNEGHAALCNLQRLIDYIQEGLTFNQALELVRSSGLYTCHTPVPAGHDYFDEQLFGKYMGGYPAMLGLTWDEFIGMGRTNPDDKGEKFSMSTFAINTCQEVNGVSKLHGWVSQKMFAPIWKGYYPEENNVGYVTNGVHFPTWCATEWRKVYAKYFDENHMNDQSNEDIWHAIYNVPDAEIWETRKALKKKLFLYIERQIRVNWLKNQGDPKRVTKLLERFPSNALVIGFCRRFATYKRAHLLFTDLERLSKIVNNPERPVVFLFAGKAHPADGGGQGLIKMIYEISQREEFQGRIIFLEDYDFQLARRLVSGVDIWMNTPTRPLEASGTSGEKAEMNGVVNLSVLDGWWVEGYREGAGWALPQKRTYQNQGYQDQLDAASIYYLLEHEIVPMYYNIDKKTGYSKEWIKVIKNSIATIAPHYTMKRQLDDYYNKFYIKEAKRFKKLAANNYQVAKEIALWKENVAERWDSIKVVSLSEDPWCETLTGHEHVITYVVDEAGLNDAIGLELVTINIAPVDEINIHAIRPFKMVKKEGNLYTFELKFVPDQAGAYKTCVRMFPKNDLLPHRQDFSYVKWLE